MEIAKEMAKKSGCAKVLHDIILVDAFTGLRRGEILGLQYRDIAGEIVVSRSIAKVKARNGVRKWRWEMGTTKERQISTCGRRRTRAQASC